MTQGRKASETPGRGAHLAARGGLKELGWVSELPVAGDVSHVVAAEFG